VILHGTPTSTNGWFKKKISLNQSLRQYETIQYVKTNENKQGKMNTTRIKQEEKTRHLSLEEPML